MPEHHLERTCFTNGTRRAWSQPPLASSGLVTGTNCKAGRGNPSEPAVSTGIPPGSSELRPGPEADSAQGVPFTACPWNLLGKLEGQLRAATSVLMVLAEPPPCDCEEPGQEEMPA